jgi:hypothetical protein
MATQPATDTVTMHERHDATPPVLVGGVGHILRGTFSHLYAAEGDEDESAAATPPSAQAAGLGMHGATGSSASGRGAGLASYVSEETKEVRDARWCCPILYPVVTDASCGDCVPSVEL